MVRPLLKTDVGPEREATLLKLPLISTLKFIKPYTNHYGLKKVWNINKYKEKPGVYVIRRRSKSGMELVRIGTAEFCLVKAIQRYFKNLLESEQKNGKNDAGRRVIRLWIENEFEVALIPEKKEDIDALYENIQRQRKSIVIDDAYSQLEPYLDLASPLPLDFVTFKPPYYEENGEKRRTYGFDYSGRSGCYLIKENGVITYVGKAVTDKAKGGLYSVSYHHFHPYGKDRIGRHYRVCYHEKFETYSYEMAFIEVPAFDKTRGELDKEVSRLESRLIYEINPRDNRKGLPSPWENDGLLSAFIQVVSSDESESTIVTGDSNDLPF